MNDQNDRPEHDDLDEIRREILIHQRAYWRFFAWLRTVAQKATIWGIFFLILYLLRDFFALIFVTFILAFVTASLTKGLGRFLPKVKWKIRVTGVFTAMLVAMAGFGWVMVPALKSGVVQLNDAVRTLPAKWKYEIDPQLYERSALYRRLVDEPPPEEETDGEESAEPELGPDGQPIQAPPVTAGDPTEPSRKQIWRVEAVQTYLEETATNVVKDGPEIIAGVITTASAAVTLLFLSLLFSFLIVLDLHGLKREVQKLEATKLHDFYHGTVLDIVKFGAVVGKVMEAQALIALINALMTAFGLWAFGLPSVGVLSIVVFVCGFIPVAGVFISSVPICLVGLMHGGISELLLLIGFITLIHMIEAYILNPRIMGAKLHVNPVLVLIVLVIGHHAIGLWGLLLGLPIAFYFFSHVIKREDREIGVRARLTSRFKIPEEL